jgi:methylglyoxal synthase
MIWHVVLASFLFDKEINVINFLLQRVAVVEHNDNVEAMVRVTKACTSY